MAKVTQTVVEIASPLAENLDLELVDVEFVKEGGQFILRVFIDRDGGVLLEHCETMSRALEEELDRLDPIEQSYLLEVSSPGVERPLKKEADYNRFAGRQVNLKLFSPHNGRKNYSGTLRGLSGEDIVLETEKQQLVHIPLSQVAKANLAFM